MKLSVILPTRNPHPDRLAQVLGGLRNQDLPSEEWELVIIDNGSEPPMAPAVAQAGHAQGRVAREPKPGLLWARLRGLQETHGTYAVFIDDDTVPEVDFLSAAAAFMGAHPRAGTAGGKVLPYYEVPPPAWVGDIGWCLALRDNGAVPLEWSAGDGPLPDWTPIGAGLLVRRAALVPDYVQHVTTHWRDIERISWQGQGAGGVEDKDLVLQCLRAGWSTGYAPAMRLTHLIPAARLGRAYAEQLIPRLERMWMRTLHAHDFNAFSPIHPLTLRLRQAKSWLVIRAWRSPKTRFAWLSSCGRLRGLADNYSDPVLYSRARSR